MERFYPIPYAASKWAAYGLDETEINRLIAEGKLDTHLCETENGDLVVLADSDLRDLAAERIDRAQFAHLVGVKIGAGEAARKYDLITGSLLRWAAQGHIKILVFDLLSALPPGEPFKAQDVETVCSSPVLQEIIRCETDIPTLLHRLYERSLLQWVGDAAYHMHAATRDFVLYQLDR